MKENETPHENSKNPIYPSYYKAGKIEAIDVIEEFGLNFCLGNTIKYILRAGKKDSTLHDLIKDSWYLDREINNLIQETYVLPYTLDENIDIKHMQMFLSNISEKMITRLKENEFPEIENYSQIVVKFHLNETQDYEIDLTITKLEKENE